MSNQKKRFYNNENNTHSKHILNRKKNRDTCTFVWLLRYVCSVVMRMQNKVNLKNKYKIVSVQKYC